MARRGASFWALNVVLALVLAACGQSKSANEPTTSTGPDAPSTVSGTRNPDSPYTGGALWLDSEGQTQAIDQCETNRDADRFRFCVEQFAQSLGAPQPRQCCR
jgi:hypothetical protein